MKRKAVFVLIALLLLSSVILLHVNEENGANREWDTYMLSELRFQDNITMTALDYAYEYRPDWRWEVHTFCVWPNETVTVLVYGNYTIECKGFACLDVNGTFYTIALNLTNLHLISLRKAPSDEYDTLIGDCEETWKAIRKKGLHYCRSHLSKKCRVSTYCPWPNGTITFLFRVNYTTVCRGYNCGSEGGTFYEVTFDPDWKVISFQRTQNEYYELRSRCNLAWLSAWGNQSEG